MINRIYIVMLSGLSVSAIFCECTEGASNGGKSELMSFNAEVRSRTQICAVVDATNDSGTCLIVSAAENINAYLTAISTYSSNKGYNYGTPDSFSGNNMSYIYSSNNAGSYGYESYWSSEHNSINAGNANFNNNGNLNSNNNNKTNNYFIFHFARCGKFHSTFAR